MNPPNTIIVLISIAMGVAIAWVLIHHIARHIVGEPYKWLDVLDEENYKDGERILRDMLRHINFRYGFFLKDILFSDLEMLMDEGLVVAQSSVSPDGKSYYKKYMLTELGKEKKKDITLLKCLPKKEISAT